MARTNKHRKKLPEVLPAGIRCVPLFVPDDPEFFAMILGAVHELVYPFRYDKGDINKSNATSKLWREVTYHPLMEAFRDGLNCETGTPTDPQDCTIINPVHPAIGYFPNHPVLTPDDGFPWPAPAWCTECNVPGLGFPEDVLIRIDSAPFFFDFQDMLDSGVPSFTLHFSGEGEIDLRFAAVPVGGTAWVFPDGNPLVGKAVDLEWVDLDDFAGSALIEILIGLLGGDLANTTTVTHEIVFDTPGSHTVTAWFFPKVEAVEWPPIGWGGGLRSIQLCGDSISLEEAPLNYTLECSADTLELLLSGAPVSTIDLSACYPHPAPPAIPDYTLNRNNGDLQLLKDAVLHDSVQFPIYSVSYFESTHLLRLWRDSVIIDTAPLPSYTLTKPEDDEIRLNRNALVESIIEDKFFTYRLQENGSQHELTEDAAVVSSVTDDEGTEPDMGLIFELHYDWTVEDSPQGQWVEISGQGDFTQDEGWVSEPLGSFQRLGTYMVLHSHFNFYRVKLEFLMASGAEGTLAIFGGPYTVEYMLGSLREIGPGPVLHVEEFNLVQRVIGGDGDQRIAVEYDGLDNDPAHQVTMTRVWVQGIAPIEAYSAHTAHAHSQISAPFAGWIFPE